MTKVRIPGTWSAAVTVISEKLGVRRAAHAAGVGDRTIYKWSDPDMATTPTLAQAAALDRAYVAAGGTSMPLLECYGRMVDPAAAELAACSRALVGDIAGLAKEAGEAVSYSLQASQPGASRMAVLRAMQETQEAAQSIGSLSRRLGAIFRRSAEQRPMMQGNR
ncbi:hypothetical protein [Sphingomonas sp. R1]|uniref:hypothetical protein n=1 Tax=Sphingomonas sp. R1 TaxID=399176 RepID=UPI0022241E8D|nr:hypothetical protein [Sphingomonas sp. R1]UYY78428.1 hypothetical protein OIM94_05345 [Sphingomonas sp. R1]